MSFLRILEGLRFYGGKIGVIMYFSTAQKYYKSSKTNIIKYKNI